MSTEYFDTFQTEFALTRTDIYRAADEGVISDRDAVRLIVWGDLQSPSRNTTPVKAQITVPEHPKGFNFVTVAYYFGAMLMISACAWFLGDKWNELGSIGIFTTALAYLMIAAGMGRWLREKGYLLGGGLLITVAVSLVPLLTYSIEDILGFWPKGNPGDYKNFYPLIHGSWIVMELATIAASALALRFVRFAFLTAPIGLSFWFFSMDIAQLILGDEQLTWNRRMWVSIAVGLCTLVIGYIFDHVLHKNGESRSEDFAFWCYLFGMFAFWGGLTGMESVTEIGRVVYALINVGLIVLAVKLRRATFLVFGAFGTHFYLGHLAYETFKDSFFFPFALAFLGLSMILVTVWAQRFMNRSKTSVV